MYNKRITETSAVRVAIAVSFSVGTADYGTINVPAGTLVQRFRDVVTNNAGYDMGKWSDWFVQNPGNLPDNGRLLFNGKHNEMFIRDAVNYGISIPPQNVLAGNEKKNVFPVLYHISKHY